MMGGFAVGYDPVDQLKRQDAAVRKFATEAAYFLGGIFPGNAAPISNMLKAWVEWQCCGMEEQIKGIEASRASMTYNPRSDDDYLMKLVDERDRQQAGIEEAEQAVAALREEQGAAMAGIMAAGVVSPLRRMLQQTEDQISQLQKSLEQRAHAVESQPVKTAEPSANTSGAD